MKKRITLIILAIIMTFSVAYSGFNVVAADEAIYVKGKNLLIDMLICTEGDVSSEDVEYLKEVVSKVDYRILAAMVYTDWTICLTGYDIASSYTDGEFGNRLRGLTVTDYKIIYIEPRAICDTPIHEIGHFIEWYTTGFPMETEELYSIYYDELDTFKSRIENPGCVSSQSEFFAETFYYMHEDISLCTPRAVEYVNYIIDSYF